MNRFYLLGALIALAACAPQPAPPTAPPPPPPAAAMPPPAPPPVSLASFNGTYAGPMILRTSDRATESNTRINCTVHRSATMSVRNGTVIIQYADYKGHILHYRGTVDPTGAVNLLHTNSDGTKAALTGQIQNNGFIGTMIRGPCDYQANLARG